MIVLKFIYALLYALTPVVICIGAILLPVYRPKIATFIFILGSLSLFYLHDKCNCNDLGCVPDIWFLLAFIPCISIIMLLTTLFMLFGKKYRRFWITGKENIDDKERS